LALLLVVLVLSQNAGTLPGIRLAAEEVDASPPAESATQPQVNPEPPLAEPGTALSAPAAEVAAGVLNDPSIARGDIRPPRPEPAGEFVDGQTTRRTRTISNGDGSFTQTTAPDSINFVGTDGRWRPIDLSLTDADSGFAKRTRANDRIVELVAGDGSALARLSGGAYRLTLGSPTLGSTVSAAARGGGYRFSRSGVPKVDIVPTGDGLYFTALFEDPRAEASIEFTFDAGDLEATKAPDGSVLLRDLDANRLVYGIDAPVVIDATGRRVSDVGVALDQVGRRGDFGRVTVTYSLAASVKADLAYPLLLDPNLTTLADQHDPVDQGRQRGDRPASAGGGGQPRHRRDGVRWDLHQHRHSGRRHLRHQQRQPR
jgi:hypothetical protein